MMRVINVQNLTPVHAVSFSRESTYDEHRGQELYRTLVVPATDALRAAHVAPATKCQAREFEVPEAATLLLQIFKLPFWQCPGCHGWHNQHPFRQPNQSVMATAAEWCVPALPLACPHNTSLIRNTLLMACIRQMSKLSLRTRRLIALDERISDKNHCL
jgi:hypothetical protein